MRCERARDPEFEAWWLRTWSDPIVDPDLAERVWFGVPNAGRAELLARERLRDLWALLENQLEQIDEFWWSTTGKGPSLYELDVSTTAERARGEIRLSDASAFPCVERIVRGLRGQMRAALSGLGEMAACPPLAPLPRNARGRPADHVFNSSCHAVAEWLEARGGNDRAPVWPAVAGCLVWWGHDLAHVDESNRPKVCRHAADRWREDEGRRQQHQAEAVARAELRDRVRAIDDALDEADY